jgi:hypothetical protein
LVTVTIIINTEQGQNYLVRQVTSRLSKNLNTDIRIGHVSFSLFNRMYLEGVLVKDLQKDTLLYAGKVKVRITDWFFIRDKTVIHYAGLEDAKINLYRKDSVWNYGFLQDYFSGGKSSGGKKGGIDLDLKKIELRNISFSQTDGWRGEDMIFRLKSMALTADEINLNSKKATIALLDFSGPYFEIRNYHGQRPKKVRLPDSVSIKAGMDSVLKWNAAGWQVHINKIKIHDGLFRSEQQADTPYLTYFDSRHVAFSSINGTLSGISWIKDTIAGNIHLEAKERSGLEIKSLNADAHFHPGLMAFNQMEIKTGKSVIRHSFSMAFDKLADFSDFITKVRMTGNFENSEISSEDIAFFVPEVKPWKRTLVVNGQIQGTVDDISGHNLNIQAGKNTVLRGDINLSGLPDINKTFIILNADDFHTTYPDAITFLPMLKTVTTPRLQSISYLQFNGNFTGFIRDFVTYGTIRTNLGVIKSDLNMKLPPGKQPFYEGDIASTDFNLGTFTGNPDIGSVSFSGKLNGRGMNPNTLSATMDLTIKNIVYNNYHYENIKAKGELNRKLFNGDFEISDTNAVASMKGIIDLSGEVPKFNFLADVDHIRFKKLNLSEEDYSLGGKFDLDFSSNSIDNFLGYARVTNAWIQNGDKQIPIDSFIADARYIDSVKHFRVNTNELEGSIIGDFSLNNLPDAFKLFLNKYYPAYIEEPATAIRPQSFQFEVKTGYIEDYVHFFDTSFRGFNNSQVKGKLNTATNLMELETDVPAFSYRNYEFQNIRLDGKGDLQKLELTGTIDHLKVNDSLNFPYTRLELKSQNDISDIRITTLSNKKEIAEGNLHARVKTSKDGIGIKFDSSAFVVNGKTWQIEKEGELEIRNNQIAFADIILAESFQEIRVTSVPSDLGTWNDIRVDLKNINIGDITRSLISTNTIEGLVSGKILLEDPVNKMNVTADIQTEQLRVDKDSIGELKADLFYNNKTGKLTVQSKNLNPDEKIAFDMTMFLKNRPANENDEYNILAENYPLKVAERFIGDLFTDVQGRATGQLKISGKGADLNYVGKFGLQDAGLKVLFTQCFYKIPDTEIFFREDAFDLGQLKLIDTVTRNTATLSRGIIKHNAWQDIQFDIKAEVDNRPMLLLNTTARDNSSFYGLAKGTGSFSLTGPLEDMRMKITGVASTTDSSYISIVNTTSRVDEGMADFLIERKYGREISDTSDDGTISNLTYDVDITGNPMVNVKVVLDELTNDEIRGRGKGNLQIIAGTNEPLSIRGRYDIDEGNYLFTFQSFFKKPFELKKDAGNYIEWTGDPYHATLKVDAVYKTEKKVDFSPIIGAGAYASKSTAIQDYVYVVAKLRGDLFKPDISFLLDFPPESQAKKDMGLSLALQQIQNTENDLNKHVAFLVVFNQFAPSDATSSLNINSGVDLVLNSISGFLSAEINGVLNDLLINKLKIPGMSVNFSGSVYNPNPLSETNSGLGFEATNLNFAIGQKLFDNRVVITFEGSYDVPFQSSATAIKTELMKNFTTEFLINKSGTIRATIFYKEDADYISGASSTGINKTRRFGGSLAYRRDFNRFRDFFNRNKPKYQPAIPEKKIEN